MPITFVTNAHARQIINEIRGAIGRNVTFYTEYKDDCPVCVVDPVTDTSTDPYCLTCSGRGYLYTYSGYTTSGHISWSPAEAMNWVAGGQYVEGDVRVQIEYTPANLTVLDSKYAIVDGKRCTIHKVTYRGFQELNRILIDMNQEEE